MRSIKPIIKILLGVCVAMHTAPHSLYAVRGLDALAKFAEPIGRAAEKATRKVYEAGEDVVNMALAKAAEKRAERESLKALYNALVQRLDANLSLIKVTSIGNTADLYSVQPSNDHNNNTAILGINPQGPDTYFTFDLADFGYRRNIRARNRSFAGLSDTTIPVTIDEANKNQLISTIEAKLKKYNEELAKVEDQIEKAEATESPEIIAAKGAVEAAKAKLVEEARQKGETARQKRLFNFIQSPRLWGTLLLAFGAGVGLYHALPLLISPRPQVILEMSFLTPLEKLFGKKLPPAHMDKIIFTESAGPQVIHAIKQIKRVMTSPNGEVKNLIFYGPPGTGKTMTAKALARSVGADYMIINSAAFEQLTPGEAVKQLEGVFRLARKNKKPVMVFLDEVDAIAAHRGNSMQSPVSLRWLNTFLANVTDTHNRKIFFVAATNRPKDLDAAFLSRFPESGWILFDRPSETERAKILRQYLHEFCKEQNLTIDPLVEENMNAYAALLPGSVGRDIRALAREITDQVIGAGDKALTDAHIRRTIEETDTNRKNLADYTYGAPRVKESITKP